MLTANYFHKVASTAWANCVNTAKTGNRAATGEALGEMGELADRAVKMGFGAVAEVMATTAQDLMPKLVLLLDMGELLASASMDMNIN